MPNYKGKVPNFETLRGILEFLSRKACHVGEYAVLMIFTRRALEGSPDEPLPGKLILPFLLVLLYSISDEWHQTFVFGRDGTVSDVLIDSAGSLLGYFFCSWRDKRNHEKEIKNQNTQSVEN